MDIIQAVVLGAVQGLTEFIPISSSAHLIVVPWLFHWKPFGIAFDVALHLGTLAALLAYFRRDWYDILRGSFVRSPGKRALLWPIILATVPGAIAGRFLEGAVESRIRSDFLLIGLVTVSLGALLFAADRLGAKRRPAEAATIVDWLLIGVAQAFAIIPGVSRSGVTITAGLACGLQRDAAARISFLLGVPIILGAVIFELPDALRLVRTGGEVIPFVAGILTSAIVGYLCIDFLMAYLRKRSTDLFVGYRLVFGVGVIVLSLLR